MASRDGSSSGSAGARKGVAIVPGGLVASTVLVLGASVSQLAAIRKARALGLHVVAVDGDEDAVAFAEADVAECVDFSDVDAVVEVAARNRVDGVVSISSDRGVPIAAAVAEALGLWGIGVETALAMTDKGRMRGRLAEGGIPQPPFVVLDETSDLPAAVAEVGTPAVLKPVDSGGQRGLYAVGSAGELAERLPATMAHSRKGQAILERYLDGDELNVMAVVTAGEPHVLTLSDRLRPKGPGFGVGWAHLFPSRLPRPVLERAEAVACEAIAALGLREGIAFPQLLAAGGEVYVVEVAARIAAGQMADLVRYGTGVDLLDVAFAQALRRPVPTSLFERRFERPVAIRFLTASPGPLPVGRLLAIEGLERVLDAAGVLDAGLYLQLGETIRPVQVDADRRGYVIATGRDAVEALARADAATGGLRLEVEHPSPTPA